MYEELTIEEAPLNPVEGELAGALATELKEIRRLADWNALSLLLHDHLFRALLTVPEELERTVEAVPAHIASSHREMRAALRELRGKALNTLRLSSPQYSPATLSDQLGSAMARLSHLHFMGQFKRASQVASHGVELVGQLEDREGVDDFTPVALISLGRAKLMAGELTDSIGLFKAAVRWAGSHDNHPAGAHAQNHLALVYALDDEIVEARNALVPRDLGPRGREGSRVWHYDVTARLARTLISVFSGDSDGAARELSSLGAEGFESDVDRFGAFWWLPVHVHARIALARGDVLPATRWLTRHLEEHNTVTGAESLSGAVLRADLADLFQSAGAFTDAHYALMQAEAGPPLRQVVASRARFYWLSGDADSLHAQLASISTYHRLRSLELEVVRYLVTRPQLNPEQRDDREAELAQLSELHGSVANLAILPPVLRGDCLPQIAERVAGLPAPYTRARPLELTHGEQEILEVLGEHDTIPALARRLHVSPNTVKARLRGLYRKLGVHSKEELYSRKAGLINDKRV